MIIVIIALIIGVVLWFTYETIKYVVNKRIMVYIESYDKHNSKKFETLYGLMVVLRNMSDEEIKDTFSLDIKDKNAIINYMKAEKSRLMEVKND